MFGDFGTFTRRQIRAAMLMLQLIIRSFIHIHSNNIGVITRYEQFLPRDNY